MANQEHVTLLKSGVDVWNAYRRETPDVRPDLAAADLGRMDLSRFNLSNACLTGANLAGANLANASLNGADLRDANLNKANLENADLFRAPLMRAKLSGANLRRAGINETNLTEADLTKADLNGAIISNANLSGANLNEADLIEARLRGATLFRANLCEARLTRADLSGANLAEADLRVANLIETDLSGANLRGADLTAANLVRADLTNADLTGCRVWGVSAWQLTLTNTDQQNLVITPNGEPTITVDNLEVAQFVYLLLHNERIREVIDTVGKKGVLLLGRFTGGRIAILEQLRTEFRSRGYVPMVFHFDKPESKDFTETIRLLAGLSHFVVVDITNPRSAPLELQATVPECMVPFVPILEKGETPFAMLRDLWIKHREWVLEPIRYASVDRLIEVMEAEIIRPAETRSTELLKRKAEELPIRDV
jgi:uncharacterized protein YjbI with pentapeptide repeats